MAADDQSRESLSLLMPQSVRIVKPFTTWANLDDDDGIDGLIVYVEPLNAAGDPIQAVGVMYLELDEFRKASGERKGKRLGLWEFPLRTQANVDARWNRATDMYEFPIVLSHEALSAAAGDKFVLTATHHSPLGEHVSDEYVLQMPVAKELLMGRR